MPRILIVDDEPMLRTTMRRMLAPTGYEIEEAEDGHEALKRYRENPAELIICDVFMPEKDGLEVIRSLTAEYESVKVIAISGGGFNGEMDLLSAARHFGAAAILYKPFDQADLLTIVNQFIVPA
ncbi:response regulator [Telmatocola sphagniphila]|jgi:CheY-like chemotaxis protein|uniref:Response regulator n=1 Tax=Telmatocola sphagniphila TaxID=1123043 RepID=A0A8E6B515_9BACT|nr:response regulator [Telmatocola sphagniphila]QVL31891.1 response regulator [Telmatocola sphagniphila]